MEDKDFIKELFKEKLGGFEAPVRPELWANISSQIGAAGAATTVTGLSILSKTIIGLSIAASVGVGAYLLINNSSTPEKEENIEKIVQQDVSQSDETIDSIEQEKGSVSETLNKKSETIEIITQLEKKEIMNNEEVLAFKNEPNIIYQPEVKKEERITEETPKVKTSPPLSEAVTPEKKEEKTIEPALNKTEESYSLEMSNVFTPNGDGTNDYFEVNAKGLSDFNVVVLNQNSKIVFQSQDPSFKWNGELMDGSPAPIGPYLFYITARYSKGELITKSSRLNIQR